MAWRHWRSSVTHFTFLQNLLFDTEVVLLRLVGRLYTFLQYIIIIFLRPEGPSRQDVSLVVELVDDLLTGRDGGVYLGDGLFDVGGVAGLGVD